MSELHITVRLGRDRSCMGCPVLRWYRDNDYAFCKIFGKRIEIDAKEHYPKRLLRCVREEELLIDNG